MQWHSVAARLSRTASDGLGTLSGDRLDSFTCSAISDELNYISDLVGDANDIYDVMALEVVFDMAGDTFDIYASNASGEAREWLRTLADEADAVGDAYGAAELDADEVGKALESFTDEFSKISNYCS